VRQGHYFPTASSADGVRGHRSRRAPRLGLLLATALLLRDATSGDNVTACSLNGEHRDGRCVCDRGWRGVDCSQAQCRGVPACERLYGNCSLGAMGNCSHTVSVTVATALKLQPIGAKTDDDERGPKVGKYTEHHNKNCCPGAGGRVMDGGNYTLMTVQQCEAHCDASPACHCIVISSNATAARGGGPGQCFRRSSCNPAGCQFDARFNAFIKPGGAPVPAPPPPAPAPRFPPKHGSICKDCKFDAVCRVE
jgi:hypothetical protein